MKKMKVAKFGKTISCLMAFGAFCAWAEGFDPSADIDTTGGVTISEPGEVTLTGKISGDGVLTYTGKGTLILTKPSPNFTGGIDVSWGEVQANVEGALGSGKITVYGGQATLVLNASDATFANDIENNGGDSATGGEDKRVTIRILENVTLTGRITSPNNKLFTIWNKNYDMSLTRPTTVYEGTVDIGTGTLFLGAYGHHNFKKALTCGTLDANNYHSGRGFVELWSPDNRISNGINHETFNIDCKAAHVLGGGYLKGCTGSANVDNQIEPRGQVYLNGFDQTVSYLDMGANILSDTGTKYRIHATDKSKSNPETEATLFLTGTGDHTTGYGLVNKVNLVVAGEGLNQAFSTKEQFATGALIASNGTITVADSVVFDKVKRVAAAPDGTIAVTAAAGGSVFGGVTALDIEGSLALASGLALPFAPGQVDVRLGRTASADFGGFSLTAKSLAIEDAQGVYQPMGSGVYDEPPVTGGEIFIAGAATAAWTGEGGEDRSTGLAANWGGSKPDLTHGTVSATFAVGGDFAAVDRALKFAGADLKSPSAAAGFAFVKADDAASITLLDGGLKTTDADTSEPVAYAFDLPVAAEANQTWTVQTNATVSLSNGLSVVAGAKLLNNGKGRLELWGESTLAGGFVSTNGDLFVSGKVATPGHVDQGTASKNGAKTFTVLLNQYVDPSAKEEEKVWNGTWPRLFLDNAVFECPVCLGGRSMDNTPGCRDFLVQTPGSTNVFKGNVTFPSPVGYVFQSKDKSSRATMVFEGGVNFNGGTHFSYSTVIVRNKPITDSNRLVIEYDGELILEVAGNVFTPQPNNARLECRVDNALPSNVAASLNGTTTVELNGTKQALGEFSNNSANTTVHGDAGSELALRKGTFQGRFTGAASLVKYGDDTVTLTTSASPSAGDITVTNGVLEIAANASWLNGTNVTVKGEGTLALGSAKALGKQTVLRLGDTGKLQIPAGGTLRVRDCFVGDTAIDPGVYTYATAPAALQAHLDAEGGSLEVRGHGLMLIIR